MELCNKALTSALDIVGYDGSDDSYDRLTTHLYNISSSVTDTSWIFSDGSELHIRTLMTRLMRFLMHKWSDYGADDSEAHHLYERVLSMIENGEPIIHQYKLQSADCWQLYGYFDVSNAFPDRDKAAAELGSHLKRLHDVFVRLKFHI